MVSPRVGNPLKNPFSKIVFHPCGILPNGVTQSLSHLLPKVSSTCYMLPKYHMKYPRINYINFQFKDMLRLRQSCFPFFFLIKHMERESFF